MDWMPISTSPKDSTDILVCRVDADGDCYMAVAQWWGERFAFMDADLRQSRYPILLGFDPTHWMPLPDPPA